MFCKTLGKVFSICWGCLVKTVSEDTTFLKNEIGFSNIGDFKKILNRAKTIDTQQLNAEPATGTGMYYISYLVQSAIHPIVRPAQ